MATHPPPLCGTWQADLAELLDDAERCDALSGVATFDVGGRLLRAPKAVLCARCPHFRAMFGSGMRESLSESVTITDASYDVYRALLDYLLSDYLSNHLVAETTLELMMLANAYGISRLEQLCALSIAALLDPQNLSEVARCAGLIGEHHLRRAAEKYAERLERSQMPSAPAAAPIAHAG